MPSGRRGVRVWVYGPDGNFRTQYESVADCMKHLGISRSAFDYAIKTGEPNRKTGLFIDYEIEGKGGAWREGDVHDSHNHRYIGCGVGGHDRGPDGHGLAEGEETLAFPEGVER